MVNINLIKKLRVNKEMTQTQLAAACGVTQGTVVGWENGSCFPRADKIYQLSQALGCDSELLLHMAEERKKRIIA